MATPTETDLAAEAIAAAREQQARVRLEQVPDQTYTRMYKKFVKWVTQQPDLSPTNGPTGQRYITGHNVDQYFLRVIPNRRVLPQTVRKDVPALQWYADNREYASEDIVVRVNKKNRPVNHNCIIIVAEREQVRNGLDTQERLYKQNPTQRFAGSDPHKGLQDAISLADRRKLFDYIYSSRDDWGETAINYAWGLCAAVRGASNRSLVLADLNMSHCFGPEEEGPLSRSFMIVLRQGPAHKDRHDKDKQICTWRHKEYKLCPNFAMGLHLLWKLAQFGEKLNFLHEDKTKRADWWDIPLIDWEVYNDASNAAKDVMLGSGVDTCKVTHHRTAALQYAGFYGLAPWQINTMTNHIVEKMFSAYQSVAEYKTNKKCWLLPVPAL